MSFPTFLPLFLPYVFHSFAFCGAPACFQAMASLCNISLSHLMLSYDFFCSFPKGYLGLIFMNTVAFFILSFFSHTVNLILCFSFHGVSCTNVVWEFVCLQIAPP